MRPETESRTLECDYPFRVSPSSWNQCHPVFFDSQNHCLVDVHIPTFANAHADSLSAFPEQLSAQGDLDISESNLQNHRMTYPRIKPGFHGHSSMMNLTHCALVESRLRGSPAMVQRG